MPRWRTCECGSCKKCRHREYVRGWYAKRGGQRWRARYASDPEFAQRVREQSLAWRQANLDKARAFDRKRGRHGTAEQKRARDVVFRAKRNGTLKPQPCEVCRDEEVHAHHDDYSKPLEVRWLCRRHHGQTHQSGRAAA